MKIPDNLPWTTEYIGYDNGVWGSDAKGRIATFHRDNLPESQQGAAAYAVHAANLYPELLAELRNSLERCYMLNEHGHGACCEAALALIQKAEA